MGNVSKLVNLPNAKLFKIISVFLFLLINLLYSCSCSNTSGPTEPEEILPIADAGPDQTVKVGQYVILDGINSKPGQGEEITWWIWGGVGGYSDIGYLPVNEGEKKDAIIGFEYTGTYRFTLTVKDEFGTSNPDTVVVNVLPRDNVIFDDPNLEVCVRLGLSRPAGDLEDELLLKLEVLHCLTPVIKDVKSFQGIENCPNLISLLAPLQNLSDISGVEKLKNLKRLHLDQNRVLKDISFLERLLELEVLDLCENAIEDISALSNLTNLTYLRLDFNPISDITPVENLINLKTVFFANAPFGDISPLSNMSDLDELWITQCHIKDLSPIKELTNLTFLYADLNEFSDLTALESLTILKSLFLANNQIKDISALEKLVELSMIRLWNNKIEDILPLVNNTGLGEGDTVKLTNNPLNEQSINNYIPELRKRGVIVLY
ncbi:leucine-rich repeat domain-containing protein [candidate division KSB1 bacterium]